MTDGSQARWPYPGSRWWKFDFHTHTPASRDTIHWQRARGVNNQLTPEGWLLKYMEAGIDCVAVTDHNTGEWIDKLKAAYERLRRSANAGSPSNGFRELTLFPGVEISVNGGFQLLAIFDPAKSTRTISDLLAQIRYEGQHGGNDGVTGASPIDVVDAVREAGGIPIPAHADQENGLLRANPGTLECALDPNTVHQVMAASKLLAVEWSDKTLQFPAHVAKEGSLMTKVLGSDCHSFQGSDLPGSRYTWIKMADPTLEGLRLALLDGSGVSVRRSDEAELEAFQTPAHFITEIQIDSARYMGNGKPQQLKLTPYCNAVIGGRGSGKSTIIHALRLAYRRHEELQHLGDNSEPKRQFERFAKLMSGREEEGALRENTKISVAVSRNNTAYRLRWHQDGKDAVVEELADNGKWQPSSSQELTAERFPIRIFSQGQIVAIAGDSRQALLDVVDEAAQVQNLHQSFEEAKRAFFSQRAQLREMDWRLQGYPELKRKLDESGQKLQAFQQSDHSEILKAHQQALRQRAEVDISLKQLRITPSRIESLAYDLLLDDWPADVFDPAKDMHATAWRSQADQILENASGELVKVAQTLNKKIDALDKDPRLEEWRQSVNQSQNDYRKLQSSLAERGVANPQDFGKLVHDHQQLESQLKQLDRLRQDMADLANQNKAQRTKVLHARRAITEARRKFLQKTLADNNFVRMEVVGYGFEARNIERSVRDLLDCQDDRFEADILYTNEKGEPEGGLAFELAQCKDESREETLKSVKQKLIGVDEKFHGRFRNFLERGFAKPEFRDHIDCWFPDDDLRIQYSRDADGENWTAITHGSQGQRSAALLAFLLAFGDEPIVLDQPEDDLDNHLIYDLIVRQIRENKLRRQLIIATHNPNIVVNGDAEMVHALDFRRGQCQVAECGALQEEPVREEVCRIMEGGREALFRRWARLGRES